MKLIGSYTSPFVRKISVLLLEKGITFEFINELPYEADNGVAQYNPLGKVPALVTEKGEYWFDSPIIAEYIELLDIAPAMLPRDPMAALKVRQLEALADGIMDAALVSVRETGASGGATIGNGTAAPAGKNQPQPGYARKLSERRDAKNGYGQSGDYRDCLCGRLSQLPPGRARLVC